jgi:hypothetical protein
MNGEKWEMNVEIKVMEGKSIEILEALFITWLMLY